MPVLQSVFLHVDENDQHSICISPGTLGSPKIIFLLISMTTIVPTGLGQPPLPRGLIAWACMPSLMLCIVQVITPCALGDASRVV